MIYLVPLYIGVEKYINGVRKHDKNRYMGTVIMY